MAVTDARASTRPCPAPTPPPTQQDADRPTTIAALNDAGQTANCQQATKVEDEGRTPTSRPPDRPNLGQLPLHHLPSSICDSHPISRVRDARA